MSIATLFSIFIGVGFIYIFILNWIIAFGNFSGKRMSSWMPLIGGVLGCGAFWFSPIDFLNNFWWIPLLIEWGTSWGFLHVLYCYVKARKG